MVALKIEDIKMFTAKLFLGEDFDPFLVREANIVTFNSFTIDGHIRQGYYTEEELEEQRIEALSSWRALRPICFSLIKGKKLPGSFSITLQLGPEGVERFLAGAGLGLSPEDVQGLCVNLRYEDGAMMAVTATSLGFFTLDKTLDREWDMEVLRFFRQKGIAFTAE